MSKKISYDLMKDEEKGLNVEKLIDFYEFTMSYSDFKNNKHNKKTYFDLFFRKNVNSGGYNISGGLEEIIDYIKNLRFNKDDIDYIRSLDIFDEDFINYLANFKFTGDIYAIPDGTPIFPNEPCITVYANVIEAQLIETDLLNRFNHGSLIATKARRIVNEAEGRSIMEFGARRAQGTTAAIIGAKYAYLAGVAGTSCYEAGKRYKIPLLGTMAHCHIMKYDEELERIKRKDEITSEDEYQAFLDYAKIFKDKTIALVDTVDTLRSGVPNAIRVAKEYLIPNGYRLKGIRLDSGDLAYLAKEARRMLDEAGLNDAIITASNSLDEYLIKDLLAQGAPIDSFGVGENLITAKSDPVFGGVYKLSAIEKDNRIVPKMKISENIGKMTNPGYKKVYRFYDKSTGYALGDVIALADEVIPKDKYVLVDEQSDWKNKEITNYEIRELQVPIFKNGKLVYNKPTLQESRNYCEKQMKTLYPEIIRLNNPHNYYVDPSVRLLKLKKNLILVSKGLISKEEATLSLGA